MFIYKYKHVYIYTYTHIDVYIHLSCADLTFMYRSIVSPSVYLTTIYNVLKFMNWLLICVDWLNSCHRNDIAKSLQHSAIRCNTM